MLSFGVVWSRPESSGVIGSRPEVFHFKVFFPLSHVHFFNRTFVLRIAVCVERNQQESEMKCLTIKNIALAISSRLRTVLTLADYNSGQVYMTPANSGRLWTTPNDSGRLSTTMDDSSRLWTTPTNSGRLWTASDDFGRLWTTATDSERLWRTSADSRRL